MSGTDFKRLRLLIEDFVDYDPDTGIFSWRYGTPRFGKPFGGTNTRGYMHGKVLGKKWMLHRLAYFLMTGVMPGSEDEIDHINHNKSDNRWSNLRLTTKIENDRNRSGPQANSNTGYRGVSFNKKSRKYEAYLHYDGKQKRLGWFDTAEDADEIVSLARAMTMPTSKDAREIPARM